MRVLHLTWSRLESYGGTQTHIVHLCHALSASGVECDIMMLPSLNSYHLSRPGDRPRLPLLNFPEKLRNIIETQQFDIVHTHDIHRPHALGISQAVVDIIAATKVLHFTTVHDVGHRSRDVRLFQSVSEVLKTTRCITTSEYNRDLLAATYHIESVALIPPALDFASFQGVGEPEPRTITYPGRLTPDKGALDAVILVGQIANSYGPLTLLLSEPEQYSYGETDQYLTLLREAAGTFPNLTILFAKHGSMAIDLYSRASLTLCMPVLDEGFGLIPLESVAAGRPVIASPTGGMSWIRGIPGIVEVPDRNMVLMARTVVSMLDCWTEWHIKARDSRLHLLKRFDASVIADKHFTLYASAVAERGASS